jgi:hypothetical protein
LAGVYASKRIEDKRRVIVCAEGAPFMTSRIRRTGAALTAGLVFGILTVSAQQSPGRWDTEKYAKLPQPAEEYTPVQVNDKLYLIGGNAAVLTPARARRIRPRHGL